MGPWSNWNGYLNLSLVSCPIARYPASIAQASAVAVNFVAHPHPMNTIRVPFVLLQNWGPDGKTAPYR